MIALTLRQRNIIEYLLSRDSYVTNDVIASNFEVSNRTVRKDLEVISAYLKEQGISLVRKPGKGVWIENKQEVLFDDLSCSYSKNERIVIYVTSLLLNDVNTFMTLASSCGVSKQTVINDLNTIEKFLDGYHLSLIKNQGVGTSLEGDETDIRRLFIDLLFTNDHSKIVYELCINNDGIQRNLDVSFELITVIENEFRFRYVDRDRISIVLSFLLNRLGLMKTKNSTIQSSDMERINSILSTKISDSNDQEYISSFLLGERVEGSLTLDSKVEDEANEISEHLISSLKKIHYFDSEDMKDIIRSLTVHVRAAIYRCRNNIHIRNELDEQVRFAIGVMYEFTKKELNVYETKYNLNFDQSEISYIALYLASIFETGVQEDLKVVIMIVCTFGLATSSILKSRMYQIFGDCFIVGPYSIEEAEKYLESHEVDLIISTNHMSVKSTNVIYINPLLKQNDIEMIRNTLFQESFMKMCSLFFNKNENKVVEHDYHCLGEYISKNDVSISKGKISWEDAIRKAVAPLVAKGDIESKYVNTMIQAVNEFGTYMVITPKVAYVHAGKDDGVNKNCVSLLLLENEIPFGSFNTKPVIAIVVLGICDKEESQLLNIANILDIPENIELLKNSKNIESILSLHG